MNFLRSFYDAYTNEPSLLPITRAANLPVTQPARQPMSEPSTALHSPHPQHSDSDHSFALLSLRATARQRAGNVCISPASMDAALRLLAEGMTEPDRKATLRHLGPSAGSIESQMGSGYQLAHGTALFYDDSVEFLPAFEARVARTGADLVGVRGKLKGATDVINRYISKNTLGIIDGAIEKRDVAASTSLLVDALGFKGTWAQKFSPKHTQLDYNFMQSPSLTAKCQMMFSYGTKVSVVETSTYLGVKLDYKMSHGQPDVQFDAMMPKKGFGVDDVLTALQRDGLPNRYQKEELSSLGVPKFKIMQRHTGLHGILRQTGLHTLSAPLYVTQDEFLEVQAAVQAVSLEVDEEGTVAAAVTMMFMAPGCAVSYRPKRDIIFDQPFAFFLRAGTGPGHVLFAGLYAEP